MRHVVTAPPAPFLGAGGRLDVHALPAWQDNLVWVLRCTQSGAIGVVDGPDTEALDAWLEAHGRPRLDAVLNTHTHGDHVGLNRALLEAGRLDGVRVYGPRARAAEVPGLSDPVDEGDRVRVGEVEGRVLRTDGHLTGHLSFVFGDLLFCGDTLFAGGCGYLFDGPPEAMHASLERLAALRPETRVCCAHEYTEDNLRFAWSVEPGNAALAHRLGEVRRLRAEGRATVPSTIGEERATNPFLRHHSAELVARLRAAMPERALDTPAAIFAATRALKDRKDYRAAPEPALPAGT